MPSAANSATLRSRLVSLPSGGRVLTKWPGSGCQPAIRWCRECVVAWDVSLEDAAAAQAAADQRGCAGPTGRLSRGA